MPWKEKTNRLKTIAGHFSSENNGWSDGPDADQLETSRKPTGYHPALFFLFFFLIQRRFNDAACESRSLSRTFPTAAESHGTQTEGCSSREADDKETQHNLCVCGEEEEHIIFILFLLQNQEYNNEAAVSACAPKFRSVSGDQPTAARRVLGRVKDRSARNFFPL